MESEEYVLIGFDKDNGNYDILETGSKSEIKNKLIQVIMNMNAEKAHEYPYKTTDNQSYDWLEIYKKNEIGRLDKRLCYTKFDYSFLMFEIRWL